MKPDSPIPAWIVYSPVIFLLAVLAASWSLPVLEEHGFRQTQTLVSSFWMTRDGPWWMYHTPVLGYPWSIPFEFPLYQWGVALLAMLPLGLNLDTAGRLVSVAALVGCAWPLRSVLRGMGATRRLQDIATLLFLSSPLHVFWGRAAMIETTALLLSLLFVVAIQRLVVRLTPGDLLLAVLFASLSALVKITTFFPFALLAGALVAARLLAHARHGQLRAAAGLALATVVPIIVALFCLMLWLAGSDRMKMGSVLAEFSTSGNLSGWNIDQSPLHNADDFWHRVVLGRMVPDILGHSVWLVLLAVYLVLPGRRHWIVWVVGCCALFLAPMLVFTRLHYTHDYYQMANATFLLVGLAALLSAASERWRADVAAGLGYLAVAGMFIQFHGHYWRSIQHFDPNHPSLVVADVIRKHTLPDDVLVVLGLKWSSEVPYYSQRRAVMLLEDAFLPFVLPGLRAPDDAGRALAVGGIVRCGAQRADIGELLPLICGPLREIDIAGCSIIVRRDPKQADPDDSECRQAAQRQISDSVVPPPAGQLALGDFSREWLRYTPMDRCNVEFIGQGDAPTQSFRRDERMTVVGWMLAEDGLSPAREPHLRVRSESMGRSWYVPLALGQERNDVAEAFSGAAVRSGFRTTLALDGMPPGVYEIMLADLAEGSPGLCRPPGKVIEIQ